MKNFTFLIICCFPFLFFGQNDQGLNFSSTSYDFGFIDSKTKAEATFLFTNESKASVEILKIHGESHCITIDNSSLKKYAPNEKGVIKVTYDTGCKGPIRKTLSVFTSNKDNTITLKLTGKIGD